MAVEVSDMEQKRFLSVLFNGEVIRDVRKLLIVRKVFQGAKVIQAFVILEHSQNNILLIHLFIVTNTRVFVVT